MPYKTVKPSEAKELLERDEGWTYLDVRTVEEFEGGHPVAALNVPFAVRDAGGRMVPNPDFVPVVKRRFAKDARLILGCAAGVVPGDQQVHVAAAELGEGERSGDGVQRGTLQGAVFVFGNDEDRHVR